MKQHGSAENVLQDAASPAEKRHGENDMSKKPRRPLVTALDDNEDVRKALIARLVKAAKTAPVSLLLQIVQSMEVDD